jgi:hypothetical protein
MWMTNRLFSVVSGWHVPLPFCIISPILTELWLNGFRCCHVCIDCRRRLGQGILELTERNLRRIEKYALPGFVWVLWCHIVPQIVWEEEVPRVLPFAGGGLRWG